MKAIRLALCVLTVDFASAAHADFSWEIEGFGSQAERDEHFDPGVWNVQTDAASVSATYYLDAVADGSQPPALAPFFDPTTSVFVGVSNDEITTTQSGVEALELETASYSVGGIYVFAQSKWYAGGGYSRGESDKPPPPPPPAVVWSDVDDTKYRLVAGKYLGSGATRLGLSLERRMLETDQWADPCVSLCSASVENTFDVESLDVMHVGRFRSATYLLFGGISRGDSRISGALSEVLTPGVGPPLTQTFDTEIYAFDAYAIGAELYPVPSVGVRLGYQRATGKTFADQDTVDVGVNWFFRRDVGVSLELSSVDPKDFEFVSRTERVELRVVGRL